MRSECHFYSDKDYRVSITDGGVSIADDFADDGVSVADDFADDGVSFAAVFADDGVSFAAVFADDGDSFAGSGDSFFDNGERSSTTCA